MKIMMTLVVLVALLVSGAASAGTSALGFEIGVSSTDQVRATLSKQMKVVEGGLNKYSGGPVLMTAGLGYDIEGLKEVAYVFDEQMLLAGILMTMSKHRFDAILGALSGKYKVSSQQRPFVGNQFARFKTSDAVIEIEAPHLSFDMEVRYIRNDQLQRFNAQSAAEAEVKKKREAAKF